MAQVMVKTILWDNDGLLHYFDLVLTREGCRRSKPDPDPCLTAIKRYGIE